MVYLKFSNSVPLLSQKYKAETLSPIDDNLFNKIFTKMFVYVDYKPAKNDKVSTPSAYWDKVGACKLPNANPPFPTTH